MTGSPHFLGQPALGTLTVVIRKSGKGLLSPGAGNQAESPLQSRGDLGAQGWSAPTLQVVLVGMVPLEDRFVYFVCC